MNMRTFVALLILLVPSPPAFAGVPGCIRGLLLDPRAYVFSVLNRQVGQPAADWEAVLQASGIPATSSVPGTVASAAFFGITQWKGSAGNVRGRLSLPTVIPDAFGYLTRSADVLADNPAWPVKCWQDARACVWAWREELSAPPYAPRQCKSGPAVANDFDGDGRSDPTVFRPSNGGWYTAFASGTGRGLQWGGASDVPVPGDYDGDGTADVAVFRPSTGTWYIAGLFPALFGASGDIPVPADYTGDGAADIAVFRPATGTWFVSGAGAFVWGAEGDIPVPADYDGDGRADIAVFRPSTGRWYITYSASQTSTQFAFGDAGDIPVPADYTGDGVAEVAIFRPSNGTWYIAGFAQVVWGGGADIPVPTDYDGDGRADIAVFRPSTAAWYFVYSKTATTGASIYGAPGDIPAMRLSR